MLFKMLLNHEKINHLHLNHLPWINPLTKISFNPFFFNNFVEIKIKIEKII